MVEHRRRPSRGTPTHFVAGILYRWEQGRLEIMYVPYRNTHGGNDRWEFRLPGGKSEPGESVEATFRRVFFRETGYTPDRWEEVGFVDATDRYGTHFKYFMLILEATGNPLHFKDMNPLTGETKTARWLDAEELLREVYTTHAPHLERGVQIIRTSSSAMPGSIRGEQ